MQDHLPDPNKNTKKARKDFQNQYFVGGMRNPSMAVKRLGLVKEAGQDILRLWNAFLKENPAALEAARSYGSDRCCLDDRVAKDWTLRLGRLLQGGDGVIGQVEGQIWLSVSTERPLCGRPGRSTPETPMSTCTCGP